MKRTIASILVLLLLAGCFGPTTERTVGSDGRAIGVTTMTTPYTPKQTIERAVNVMKRLQLSGDSTWGGGLFSGTEWTIKSDYYSATTRGKTAAGEGIDLTATWIADGKTELKIRSSLTEAQHSDLVAQIAAGMK